MDSVSHTYFIKNILLNSENNNNIHFIPLSPWIKSNMNYERRFSQIQCVAISFSPKTSVHVEKFHSFTHIANIFHGEWDCLLFNEKDGHNINPIEWNELCANYSQNHVFWLETLNDACVCAYTSTLLFSIRKYKRLCGHLRRCKTEMEWAFFTLFNRSVTLSDTCSFQALYQIFMASISLGEFFHIIFVCICVFFM